jgi:hypothetical protein
MGNVAAFKTRITLESDQYIAGWKKVESATTDKVSGIEKAISKGMKSWSNSMGKAIGGFLGIQLADTLLKSIDDTLKNPIFNTTGANIAYAIGDGLAKTLESIPVVGTIGKMLGQSESGDMEARQKASRDDAARNERMLAVGSKMVADLEKQRELAAAVSDEQRTRVERAQRLAELEKQLNDQMAKENATGPQILAAREKLRAAFEATSAAQDQAIQRQEREKMIADELADAEAKRLKTQEEAAKRAEMRAAAEERREESVINFMEELQDALDERTMTEEQLFQKKMDRLGLDAQEQENARALNEKLKAAEAGASKTTAVSNIESIQSAVGSVKMAGTTSGLDKLAKPAEATAKATQASATHLAKLAAATGAV